jgi:hypothetical protein
MRTPAPRSRAARALALAALLAALASGCSDDGDDGSGAGAGATASPTAVPSDAPAGPPPPSATASPSVGISSAPAVDIGKAAELKGDVVVKVEKVARVQTQPVPGEVPGPGVAVTMSIRNGTANVFDLTGLVVTASFGKDEVPGDTSSGDPSNEMRGDLAPGTSSSGVYVFRIPDGEKASGLHLQVSSDESPTVVQFAE